MNNLNLFIQDVLTDLVPTLKNLPGLTHILTLDSFPSLLLSNLTGAAICFVCVELSRDIFHFLGHRWSSLIVHHRWHHTAYKRGYIKRLSHYFTALWHHDIPEGVIMLLIAVSFCIFTFTQPEMTDYRLGCTLVLLRTLDELGNKVLRIFKVDWAIQSDTMHQAVQLTAPPSQWLVNPAFHYRHHFGDPNAYFGGIITLFDKLLKTALSLKGRTINFFGHLGELDSYLRYELQQAGAHVVRRHTDITFEDTDILVFDLSTAVDICPQTTIQQMEQFLKTVHTNEEITTKEIWLIVSDAESALAYTSLNSLYQRFLSDWLTRRRTNSPCILRKIVIGTQMNCTTPQVIAKRIVNALRRDIRNIVVRSHPWVHVFQPLKEWMLTTYFQFIY